MRAFIIAASALGLAACASGGGAQFADFAKTIASDPRCGHTDRVQGNLGGVTGNNLAVYLERVCPPTISASPEAPVPAAKPS